MDAVIPAASAAKAQLMDKGRALVPVLRSRATAANRARVVPRETIEDFWNAGLYGLLKPKRFGGQEMRYDDFLDLGTELGRGDGSQAWIYSVLGAHELMIAWYPESVQAEIWSNPRALVASSFTPNSKPAKAPRGWRVSGKWEFCSGVDVCQWIILGGMFGLEGTPPRPDIRLMVLPLSDCKIVDDWHALGLRGTGSKSVAVDDVFVPEERVLSISAMNSGATPGGDLHAGRLYRAPIWAVFPFCLTSPASGIAQAGIEHFIAMTAERAKLPDPRSVARIEHSRPRIAEAAAMSDAAELLYKRSSHETVDRIENGETLSLAHRMRNRRDQTYSVVLATRALELLFRSTGGHGLYDDDPVQRTYRDLQAMGAHIAVSWDLPAASYGNVALGGAPLDFLF